MADERRENRIEADEYGRVEDIVQRNIEQRAGGNTSNIVSARGHSSVSNVRQDIYSGQEGHDALKGSGKQARPVSAIMLTSHPQVYQELRRQLSDLREEVQQAGTIYERGRWHGPMGTVEVGLAEIEASMVHATLEAERAISYFQPAWAMLVGLAGGMKDVQIGDVVVATKIYDYERGKADTQLLLMPEIAQSSYALIQRARAEARNIDWSSLRTGARSSPPKVWTGPIAAGEKIMTSRHSPLYAFLQHYYGDALAVETEGYGFLRVTHANPHIGALVLRGISHLIGEPASAAANTAALHVSAFAWVVLQKLSERAAGTSP
jgi:nucleoside phosphorylase